MFWFCSLSSLSRGSMYVFQGKLQSVMSSSLSGERWSWAQITRWNAYSTLFPFILPTFLTLPHLPTLWIVKHLSRALRMMLQLLNRLFFYTRGRNPMLDGQLCLTVAEDVSGEHTPLLWQKLNNLNWQDWSNESGILAQRKQMRSHSMSIYSLSNIFVLIYTYVQFSI